MFRTKKLFFLGIFFMLQIMALAHPLHVCICQIGYNEQNQKFEIYIKVFADDLLTALTNSGAPELYLGEDREISQTDSLISTYLQSKFSILVNGKKTDLSFIGKEMETDAVWCYFESKKIDEPEQITVRCSILTEIFDTQNNIVQISKNSEILSMMFDRRKTEDSIKF